MIGGVSGSYPVLVPADRGSDRREPAGNVALPAPLQPPGKTDDQVEGRRDQLQSLPAQDLQDENDFFQRRVEARAQAQAARLERDDAPALPRQSQQALQTYSEIASTRETPGVELVGLNLQV